MSDMSWRTGAQSSQSEWREALRASLVEHRFYLGYIGAYLVIGTALLHAYSSTNILVFVANVLVTIMGHLPFILALTLIWAFREIMRTSIDGFIPYLGSIARQHHLTPHALARSLPIIISVPLMFGIFFSIKANMEMINPYHYDALFARWSIWLGGGEPTWKILQAWFGARWVVITLNALYCIWFPVVHITFYWQVLSTRRPALRLQFITAFVACWGLLGSFLALAMPSAGPAFFGLLTGKATPYDGLLDFLRNIQHAGYDVAALDIQSELWQSYTSKAYLPFSGMSAMPSLHVSMAVLMALLGWKISRFAGAAYSLFAVSIAIGSVMLAFHYAVDGYVAGALTALIWIASGKIALHVYPEQNGTPFIREAANARLLRV